VRSDQRSHHHSASAGRARHHAASATESGGKEAHDNSSPQADDGRHAGDKGEGDRLRDHREGDGEAREHVRDEGAPALRIDSVEEISRVGHDVFDLRGRGR